MILQDIIVYFESRKQTNTICNESIRESDVVAGSIQVVSSM